MSSRKLVFVAPTSAQLADPRWSQGCAHWDGFSKGYASDSDRDASTSSVGDYSKNRHKLHWSVHRFTPRAVIVNATGICDPAVPQSGGSERRMEAALVSTDKGDETGMENSPPAQTASEANASAPRKNGLGTKRARRSHMCQAKSSRTILIQASIKSPLQESMIQSQQSIPDGGKYASSCSSPDPSFELEKRAAAEQTMKDQSPPPLLTQVRQRPAASRPGRTIGISRMAAPKRPPILKSLQRRRMGQSNEEDASSIGQDRVADSNHTSRPVDGSQSNITDTRMNNTMYDTSIATGGGTTIESIAPPPPHDFLLSNMTLIADILTTPERWLSNLQGGADTCATQRFNLLALVTRVGPLDKVKDWKAAGDIYIDRCEIAVRDESGCMLRINLDGPCASQWAGYGHIQGSYRPSIRGDGILARPGPHKGPCLSYQDSFDSTLDSCANSHVVCADETSDGTLADTSYQLKQRALRMLPIKAGDVVALHNLRLVRSRPRRVQNAARDRSVRRHQSLQSSLGSGGADSLAQADMYATASQADASMLELCWRNVISDMVDQDRNFDPDLAAFNARCRAIYKLAMSWQSATK